MGSSFYEYTDKVFPAFVEDIRKRNMQEHLEEVDTSRRSVRIAGSVSSDAPSQRKMFTLSPNGKTALLKLTAADSEVSDRREVLELGR